MGRQLDDPESGIAWARAGLAGGVVVSIAGNVANTIYLTTEPGIGWRIPGAVVWPSFLFLAIEIMVRNRHRTHRLGYVARALLMSVSVATFVTSYVNLHEFMIKTGEPGLAQLFGPIGIDGLMLGSTLMLLAASLKSVSAPALLDAHEVVLTPNEVSDFREQLVSNMSDADIWAQLGERLPERPVSAPPAPVSVPVVSGEREQKSVSGQQSEALTLLMEGKVVSEVVSATGVSRPTVQRIKGALTALVSDPQADVSKYKLNGELVSIMRKAVRS